jgi:hypothetical protein
MYVLSGRRRVWHIPMSTFSLDTQPTVFFSDTRSSDSVRYALKHGRVRQLGPRLYTADLSTPAEELCRRYWIPIASGYFPGAVLGGRTALTPDAASGTVFLTYKRAAKQKLPGLEIVAQRGPGPIQGDTPFAGSNLFIPSRARAFLENSRFSRRTSDGPGRTLNTEELEAALLDYGRHDLPQLNLLRDEAHALAPLLGLQRQDARLNSLIGALQGTVDAKLASNRARAVVAGLAYDQARIEKFEALYGRLLQTALPAVPERPEAFDAMSFYEAYFSNYIEGTDFTVPEAKAIVFDGLTPAQRPQDAHDVLATYELIRDPRQRARTPSSAEDLLTIIRSQHGTMLHARPEIAGEFKRANNQVGGREFVDWRLVRGTLHEGYKLYATLPGGLARAIYAMFLIAEVHPFADGNGRIGRLLMNSELSAAGLERIIVTARQRDSYLGALSALTTNQMTDPLINALVSFQRETRATDYSSLNAAQVSLETQNAFTDPHGPDQAESLVAMLAAEEAP